MNQLIRELQRRNVIRVAAAYLVVGWIVMQIVDVIGGAARLPDWADAFALIVLIVAFPVIIFIAWAFELTPEGMKRTDDVPEHESQTARTGASLNIAIIAGLAIVVALLAWQQFAPGAGDDDAPLRAAVSTTDETTTPRTEPGESAVETPARSVAVLPFLAFSAEDEHRYFADGLTEEILNSLAYIPDLIVTSRTSSFQFRGENMPSVPEIAAQLGVAHILEGSVRQSGGQYRVTAQLIRAADDAHLWSQTYDRSMEDVFAIQEEIAESIAEVLGVALDGDARERMAQSGTTNMEAFVAYQHGRELFQQAHGVELRDATLEQANEKFTEAIAHDPGFAAAYYSSSDRFGYILLDQSDIGSEWDQEAHGEALTEYARLLDLAESNSSDPDFRNFAQIDRQYLSEDWTGAGILLDRVDLDGTCQTSMWLPEMAILSDRAAQIADLLERWTACDPLSDTTWTTAMRTHIAAGNYQEALELAEILATRATQADALALERLNLMLVLGRDDEVRQMLNAFSAPPEAIVAVEAVISAQNGDTGGAEAILEQLLAAGGENVNQGDLLMFAVASGQRHLNNEFAARMDERPFGHHDLLSLTLVCMCGAPWDLEATPNFAERIEEANFNWPPAGSDRFPANRDLD
ncbi:hypothetical protein [Hyphobacterium sp.]|uniref:hypothetical protein n=1 Tax=Hyphobacterium sp. TaxID=2004662 RepID=UPI003B52BE9B